MDELANVTLVMDWIRRLTLYSTKGIGMNAIAKKPSNEEAQPTPSLVYMADANSGNPAPNADLKRSLPARTEAAYSG